VSGPGEPGGAGAAELTARSGRFSLPVRVFGQGIPMIFLHGLGSDSRDSRRDLGELPGFRLALPDQRGHGGSRPRPDPGEFALDSMVGDLRATLAALDWPATVVAGGSMGAAVALRHVLTGPADCPALVLVAPALGPDRPDAAPLLTAIADRIDAVGLQQAVAELRGGAAAGERDGAAAGEGGGAAAGEGGGAAAGERDGAAAGERDGAAAGERDRGSATERDGGRHGAGHAGSGGGPAEAGDGLDCWLRQDGAALAAGMRAVPSWRPLTVMDDLAALTLPVALVAIHGDPLHPVDLAARMHAFLPRSSLEVLGSPDEARRPGAIGEAVLRGLRRLGIS
jgi:pimeloyl-ACP methyl ester carboxylesterase